MIELTIISLFLILPLIFGCIAYDIESTGKAPMIDRVVQICLIQSNDDGSKEILMNTLVNPGIPIHPEATAVHGITDNDVKDAPTFKQLIPELEKHLSKAKAIIGYNTTKFDNVMFDEEMRRNGSKFKISSKPQIDVKRMLEHVVPRDLNSVSKRYLGREIEGAHDASVDTIATIDVKEALEKLGGLTSRDPLDIASILSDGHITGDGRIVWEDGKVVVKFGKLVDQVLFNAVRSDVRYINWMLGADPAEYTWISRELIDCISKAVKAKSEEQFNEMISEKYGHQPHICTEHMEFAQDVIGNEHSYDIVEIAYCGICSADLTAEMEMMYLDYEPDEDRGRDR